MIKVLLKDITELEVDAIVNAANEYLFHGGGVAKAIATKGGRAIIEESNEYIKKHGKLKVTDVIATSAGNLKARYVLHAVGPRGTKPKLLEKTIINIFEKAKELKINTIALPAISCGVFGFDKALGTKIIVEVCKRYEKDFKEIILATIDEEVYNYFNKWLNSVH